MKIENLKTEDNSSALTSVGIFAALAASLCCITPVLALIAGASGVASAFSWLDPARPYLIGLAVVALSYAWYRSLFPAMGAECGPDGICKVENKSFLASRTFLIIITILAIVLMAFPFYSKIFYPQAGKQTEVVSSNNVEHVTYKVRGMTCAGCEETIKHSVNQLKGIVEVKADSKLGTASIKYDQSKTDKNAIIKAINATGYKAEASAQTSPVKTVSKSDPKEVSLKITGMTCAGCTSQIHTALSKTYGVIKNEVKYPGNVAIIKFDSSKVSVSELIKVIEKTGYKVEIQKV